MVLEIKNYQVATCCLFLKHLLIGDTASDHSFTEEAKSLLSFQGYIDFVI